MSGRVVTITAAPARYGGEAELGDVGRHVYAFGLIVWARWAR